MKSKEKKRNGKTDSITQSKLLEVAYPEPLTAPIRVPRGRQRAALKQLMREILPEDNVYLVKAPDGCNCDYNACHNVFFWRQSH
jgi:hypothetical protein